MPLIDMPMEKLLTFAGRNPRPPDHDAYWDRALKELDEVDPAPEFVPVQFVSPLADCFDLYYTGVRGARIHAKFLKPKKISGGGNPAVLRFHGYSGNAGAWTALFPYAAAGMITAAMDARGQGGLSRDSGGVKGTTLRGHIIRGLDDDADNLLFRHIFLDTVQLFRVVAALPEVDEKRIGAAGGSQGGGLTVACASLAPVALAAPVYPFLCDYKRVWEMDLFKDAYQELKDYFRLFDPRHEREDEIFTKLGYIDLQFLSPRIKGEVLMFTGLMDTVCPPSSQFAMYNKIKSPKNVHIYPDFAHEGLPDSEDLTFQFFLRLLK